MTNNMAARPPAPRGGYTAAELLGPLNDVESKHAPDRLFAAGDRSLVATGARVAVIGSRRPSPEGLRRARKLARALAREGVTVVSGLAEGIDTAAHLGALAAGGRTVAVLGTPLDIAYPRQNRELQLRIMAEHLALSPFAPGTPVVKRNFPLRNRLMALIAHATVIVEASETSGALSQGWEAIRLGRLLFVLRSAALDPGQAWAARLIHYGAQVLTETSSVTRLLPAGATSGLAAAAF